MKTRATSLQLPAFAAIFCVCFTVDTVSAVAATNDTATPAVAIFLAHSGVGRAEKLAPELETLLRGGVADKGFRVIDAKPTAEALKILNSEHIETERWLAKPPSAAVLARRLEANALLLVALKNYETNKNASAPDKSGFVTVGRRLQLDYTVYEGQGGNVVATDHCRAVNEIVFPAGEPQDLSDLQEGLLRRAVECVVESATPSLTKAAASAVERAGASSIPKSQPSPRTDAEPAQLPVKEH